ERGADSKFRVPARRLPKQQIHDIGACYQQEQTGYSHQDQQRGPGSFRQGLTKWHHIRCHKVNILAVLLFDSPGNPVQFRVRLFERNSIAKPADDMVVMCSSTWILYSGISGKPDLRIVRIMKARRKDANNGCRLLLDSECD